MRKEREQSPMKKKERDKGAMLLVQGRVLYCHSGSR